MRRFLLLLPLLVVTACENPFAPDYDKLPEGAVDFTPDSVRFARLWAEVEECSGRTRPMAGVRWMMVPGVFEYERPHGSHTITANATWYPPSTVVFAEKVIERDGPVKHEMLHVIMQERGHGPAFDACQLR
jgi:hypothetical protein